MLSPGRLRVSSFSKEARWDARGVRVLEKNRPKFRFCAVVKTGVRSENFALVKKSRNVSLPSLVMHLARRVLSPPSMATSQRKRVHSQPDPRFAAPRLPRPRLASPSPALAFFPFPDIRQRFLRPPGASGSPQGRPNMRRDRTTPPCCSSLFSGDIGDGSFRQIGQLVIA